jgi:hypothetical protein
MTRLLALVCFASTLGGPCLASETREVAPQNSPQPATPQSPFAALIAEYLHRDANGHSPEPDEIAAMATLQPQPDPASIREAMPFLLKALDNPDIPLHTFALNALIGLQTAAPINPNTKLATGPSAYKPEVAQALAPSLPQIASHLTSEESQPNRLLVVAILGAFTVNPPAAVYAPLLAYLKRDDAISPVGLAVVGDLIQLGPISEDTSAAITRYLRRSDQNSDQRADLADLIATSRNQSRSLNKALLTYLISDDNRLRARIILSLPQLDLSPEDFSDTKSRVEQLAGNTSENLQVVTAAKAISTCWTGTRMTTSCPVY